ncbi:MAG TPA: flagellar filament capping protein FliD, partial [Vicinamibacterales bacterium]|nr:flagellar filament capping protein FliD [Vicinamibacterales bacterium]
MSGSVPAASSATNVPGTNVPPISFPGISSGIDYNSIITQLTSLTLEQNVQPNTQIATLNAANLELIKINSMLASVQNALTALSQPSLFDTYDGTSSNTNVATAQGIPSVAATPGTYVIDSATLATASQQVNSASAGHKMTDLIGGTPSDQVPLANSYAAVTPSNGSGSGPGKVTIDGVTVNYDVTSQSLQTIFSNIQTAVRAVDPTFTIGYGSGDTVQVSGSKPITLGSAGDQGNLLSVLKLDQAPINNSGPGPYTVNGTSGIGGINQATSLNAANGAGYVTPVTSGTFTINGVQISVNTATDNTASVLAKINGAGAGVVANYDAATNQITLTATSTGPQSIVLGSSSDTSNFLSAAGLTTAGGAPPQTIGTQAQVVVQTSTGPQTYYSNSNQVTNAIPGMQINLQASTAQPFTVTVSQDSTQLVSAINTFVSAYNTAINEINQATAPPVVISANSASLPGTSSAQSLGGGIL